MAEYISVKALLDKALGTEAYFHITGTSLYDKRKCGKERKMNDYEKDADTI